MSNQKQTILIFGLGLSGKALASFFEKRNARLLGYDDHINPDDFPFMVYHEVEKIPFEQIDLIAYSPGIPKKHPLFIEAQKKKIPTHSEIEIGIQEIKGYCIGVTGTNGKSTVTSLIAHLLNHAGYLAIALGNIGVPLTSKVDELTNEVVVLELSSYHIDELQVPFLDQGLLLNISEDHLDWYGSFEAYKNSKFSIQNCIKKKGRFILFDYLYQSSKEKIYFENLAFFGEACLFNQKELKEYWSPLDLISKLNFSAAYQALLPFNIGDEQLFKGLQLFRGLAHRCERVDILDGRLFVNDSKATNLNAVKQALCSFPKPIRLLMGGKDKELDFSPLVPYVKSKVKKIYAIGEVQNLIADQLSGGAPVECLDTLNLAFEKAWSDSAVGEVILLSPGTSSFDQFKNFEHRGNEFKRLVSQLKGVHV